MTPTRDSALDHTFGLPSLSHLPEMEAVRLTRIDRSVIGHALRRHVLTAGPTESYLKGVLVDRIETSTMPLFGSEPDVPAFAFGVPVLADLPPVEYLALSRGQRSVIAHALRATPAVGATERYEMSLLRDRVAGH